jgi:O-antigen/teichoic acid export membrane protein
MQAGLSAPRLLGLLLWGIPGCFGVLAVYYALTAALLNQPFSPTRLPRSSPRAVRRTLGAALPLFAFNAVWLFYLTANRWIASALSAPEGFGLFAFGANLVAVSVGLLMTIAQVHYPKHLATDGGTAAQDLLDRDLLHLVGLTAAGSLAGVLACRFGIAVIFPHFAAAAESSAALMASTIPLGLAGCVMPLVVAMSHRPVHDTVVVFTASFGLLGAAMVVGNAIGGISGQAWGCALASLMPPFIQLSLLSSRGMLRWTQATRILAAAGGGIVVDALAWGVLFWH